MFINQVIHVFKLCIEYAAELNRSDHATLMNKGIYTSFFVIPSLAII